MEHAVKETIVNCGESFTTLTDEEEKELYRLHRLYYREAGNASKQKRILRVASCWDLHSRRY